MSAQPQEIRTPFQYAKAYVKHGWILINNKDPDSKNPNHTGWNEFNNCIRNVEQIPEDISRIGLANYYSGVAVIDLDNIKKAREMFAEVDIDIDQYLNAPNAVHLLSGRKNRDKLLFRVDSRIAQDLHTKQFKQGKQMILELRCSAKSGNTVQDLLPPTIHPKTGKSYFWKGDWRKLPPLPNDIKRYWYNSLERKPRAFGPIPEEQIDSALEAIDSDCDYSTWREIGMALHSEGYGDKWTEWSATGAKYKKGETERMLEDFDPEGGVTISTLFYSAREAGWVSRFQSPYTLNDLGNAQRLALAVADRFRYIADLALDMTWSSRGWVKDRNNTLHRAFKKVIDAMLQESTHLDSKQGKPLFVYAKTSGNAAKIKAACDLARMESPIRTLSDQWDADGDLVTFSCGTVLNVRTMESRPMHQGDLIRRRINAPFDLEATCPEFEYLINHLVDGDSDARAWLLQLWSTGLISSFRQKIIFVLYGASDSGKTTTVEVVKCLLGDFAVSPPSNFIIRPKYPNSSGPNAEIINLLGKRAAFISEFPRGRLDDNKLKNLTGSDTMTVRRLYSNEFIDVPCRLTITISSQSKPFFRRNRRRHVDSYSGITCSQTIGLR